MRQSYLIIYNSATNYARYFMQMLVGFLVLPMIIGSLDKESYGVVIICMTSLQMVELFGIGLGKAVTKYIAEFKANNEAERINSIFNSALAWFLLIACIGFVLLIIISVNFGSIFNTIEKSILLQSQISLAATAFFVVFCLMFDAYKGALFAIQRYDIVNIVDISRAILRLVAIFVYTKYFKSTLLGIVLINGLSITFMRVAYFLICQKLIPEITFRPFKATKKGTKMVVGFATMMLLITAANMLSHNVINYMIGFKLSLDDVANYGIMLYVISIVSGVVRCFVNVLTPVASKYQGLKKHDVIRDVFFYGTKYTVIMSLASFSILFPVLKQFLSLWVGEGFVPLHNMLTVMLFAQVVVGCSLCSNQVLCGLGKVKPISFLTMLWALLAFVFVGIYLFLYKVPELNGVVIIMSLFRVLGTGAILLYGINEISTYNFSFFANIFLRPVFVCVASILLSKFFLFYFDIKNWIHLICYVFILSAIYVYMVFVLCISELEKKYILSSIKKLKKRIAFSRDEVREI